MTLMAIFDRIATLATEPSWRGIMWTTGSSIVGVVIGVGIILALAR